MKSSSVSECPYCHTELLKNHHCPGAREDVAKVAREMVIHRKTLHSFYIGGGGGPGTIKKEVQNETT